MRYRHYALIICYSVTAALQAQTRVGFEFLENRDDVYYYKNKPFTGISVETFDKKTKKQEISWQNGVLHGSKIEYFSTGLIRARINFEYGRRNGPFTYWYINGKIKQEGTYVNDLLEDTLTEYYENGKKQYQYIYRQGVKEGPSLVWHDNGKLSQEVNMVHGIPEGIMRTYYEAGNLRYEGNYVHGVRNGRYTTYHLTGLKAEESYYKNGEKDSVSYFWDNVFGDLMKQEYYKMGVKDGEWITYGFGGDTLSSYFYKDGIYDGPYRIWVAGKVDETGYYSMGKRDGTFKTGMVKKEFHTEGQYTNGVTTGVWNYYDPKGRITVQETYDETGELIKVKVRRKFLFIPYYQSETQFTEE